MIRLAAAFLTVLAFSACVPDGPPKLAPVGQANVDAAKARCEAAGGSFGPAPGGKGGMICFHRTRDAGKICTAGSQCEGQCLARSGTCAPVTPLMGCQDVLLDGGVRMTQCIN